MLGHTIAYLWQLITRMVTSWSLRFRRLRSLWCLLHSRLFPSVIPATTDPQHSKWYNSPLWCESASLFGHLPDSSDLDGVLSTFPPEPSTARSGCPPNPKKSGVKGMKGMKRMNPKKSGVKPRVKPTKSGVKPGVKPEKQPEYSQSRYHKNAYYIDLGASHHIVFNGDHLDNIQELDDPLQLAYGGNDINMTQLGSLSKALSHLLLPKQGYYYNQNVVTNLISLGKIADAFTVVMNTAIDDAIYIYGDKGKYLRFSKTKTGLYKMELHLDKDKKGCFFATVKGMKAMFSELDCKRAEAVRELQERLGYPSDVDLARAIEYNVLSTCQFN